MDIPENLLNIVGKSSPPSDDDIDEKLGKWKGADNLSTRNSTASLNVSAVNVTLGPGQIHPKGYRLTTERYGELKLGLFKSKGVVEVEVIILF